MGQGYSGIIRSELTSSRKVAGFNPIQLKLLREKFVLMCDDDLSIDIKGFMDILRMKEDEARDVFKLFDIDNSSRIDSYEFICAMALLGYSNLKDKAEVIFGLFDFDNSLILNKDELVVLFRCVICSLQAMCGKKAFPTITDIEKKVNTILEAYDMATITQITLGEFQSLVSKDFEILKLLRSYGLLLSDDLKDTLDGSNGNVECDSDVEMESKKSIPVPEEPPNEQMMKVRKKNFANAKTRFEKAVPSNYKNVTPSVETPDVALEMAHVYGYRGKDCRNNVRFASNGDLVSFTSKIAWVTNHKNNSQKLFLNHTHEISCMSSYGNYFATGETAPEPTIYIWDFKSTHVKTQIKGTLRGGVAFLAFSNDGKKLAAVEASDRQTVVVYDFFSMINGKSNPRSFFVSTFEGPSKPIYDICFDYNDSHLVFGCKKNMYFAAFLENSVELKKLDKWGQEKQSILCLACTEQAVVGGGYSGSLIVFRNNTVSNLYKGHKGPCAAIWVRPGGKGLLTGGYDGEVIIWDSSFNKTPEIKLQNDVKISLQSYKIKAVCQEAASGDIVVGTKAGDIIEFNSQKIAKFMNKGHMGDLTGLDKVGSREEAVTVAKNKDLIIWDLAKGREKKVIPIDFEGSEVSSSFDGMHMAVGFVNGYVEIIEANNATVIKKIKDRSTKITAIRYSKSPELNVLAIGGEDCELILYRVRENYKTIERIKGFKAPPKYIDFSEDGKVLQVVDEQFNHRFYDTASGSRHKSDFFELRDEKWHTWTCPVGWTVQGLFSNPENYHQIYSMALSPAPEKSLLAVGMRNGDLRLYKYPVIGDNPFYTKFLAHTSPIAKIIFCEGSKNIVTIGEKDRTVIHWKYTYEEEKGSGPLVEKVDKDHEYFESLKNQYTPPNPPIDPSELRKGYIQDVKSNVREELKFPKRQGEAPDTNLELKHIFGCKYEGLTYFTKYNHNNSVVFFTGNKGVVKESGKDSKTQSFFTAHSRDINCMDLNKTRELVATAENSKPNETANIFVWHSETKDIVAKFETRGTGGVIKVAFSPETTRLISISNDEHHTMDIFEVSSGNFLNSIKTEKSPILDISFKNDFEFVTITASNIRFWDIKGPNIVSSRGNWMTFLNQDKNDKEDNAEGGAKKKEPDQLSSVIYAFLQNICLSGTANGYIYTWQNNSFSKSTVAHHPRGVRVMVCHKNILYTGGDDGTIKTWNFSGRLVMANKINLHVEAEKDLTYEVRSLDLSSEGVYLVGTNRAMIFAATETSFETVIQSHASKSIRALAVHPTTSQFVTAGDDRKLIKWDAISRGVSEIKEFKDPNDVIIALDWSSNGEYIVAATIKGKLFLFDKSLIQKHSLELGFSKSEAPKISCIKLSPNLNLLAVGVSKSPEIELVNIIEKDKTLQRGERIKSDQPSGVRFMDWSTDGEYLACSFDSFEIRFFAAKNTSQVSFAHVKDRNFVTWTQPMGTYVRGIKIDEEILRYSPVCRSVKIISQAKDHEFEFDNKPIRLFLAGGDREGNVKLFRYPSVVPNADFKSYRSHSQNISQIRVFNDSNFIVAISDSDNSIVIYETDVKNDTKLVDNIEAVLSNEREETLFDSNALVQPRESMKRKDQWLNEEEENPDRKDLSVYYKEQEGGERGKLGKPWMASLTYPTDYLKPKINGELAPKLNITPEYVFGFRTKDCRGNLKYINQNEIIYCSACFVVVHAVKENTQRFFTHHKTDVTCFSLKPDSNLVASADAGVPPNIYIWSPSSLSPVRHIEASQLKGGISKIQFCAEDSSQSSLLAVICTDPSNTVAVFNYVSGAMMYSARGDTAPLFDLKWTSPHEFVTAGLNHIKFWKIENNQMRSVRGKFDVKGGQQGLLCLAINKRDVLAGTAGSNLLVWKRSTDPPVLYTPFKSERTEKGVGSGAIECITVTEQNIFLAGRQGIIHVMTNQYVDVMKLEFEKFNPDVFISTIRAIDAINEGRKLILGTFSSEIFELNSTDLKISPNSTFTSSIVNKGPFTQNSVDSFEMWGLAMMKTPENFGKFVTCSDEGFLRIWSITDRAMLGYAELNTNAKDEPVFGTDDGKLRAISLSPREDTIAVGCKSGLIRIINIKMTQIKLIDITKAAIYDIKYSPSGTMLAVGAEPNTLEVYNVGEYRREGYMKKHSGPLNHIDWSGDSQHIQTNSLGQELLFFIAKETSHLTDIKAEVRNETWASHNCVYSWSTQGIWKDKYKVGTEINMVDRSNTEFYKEYQALAVVDDSGAMDVYKYPCIKAASESVTVKGHSSFITNVRWSPDDSHIITTGGEDQTIIVWKVEQTL